MRKVLQNFLLVTSYSLLVTSLCGCQDNTLHKDTQVMMGTFVEVISPYKDAPKIVFAEIRQVENLLSKYKEDSEVTKLNQLGKLKVSLDTLYVLQKAKEFWQLSDGAFDITVGPLIDLWGFTDKKYRLPGREEIEKTLNTVGFDKIIFNISDNVVKFKLPGMKIDLGAIAKGYAVDCAVKKLKEHGIKSCLINAGGQIYCLGDKFGKPWRIAIRNPRKDGLWDYLELKNKAVSTSGDYEQYFSKGNKRYSHILNPKTGYPTDSGIISTTVIANDG
ncbi:MAG: FAD:protein FMN transferase, partial [Candidatus Omnitrophota bacterium]|nr:FAD:protein FMN transferase [Candidatus Omnitrophota bacterium]